MTARSRAARARRPAGRPLAAEIAIVVAIKAVLLFALARLFFAAPEAQHMRMDPARVQRHVLESR
jgi:hypothetical protein